MQQLPYSQQSDADLELLAARGEYDAFGELYNRHFDRVYDFVLRMVRDEDEAADIAQETFLRAMKALKPGDKVASFSTWVFTIARNLTLNRLSGSKRTTPLVEAESAGDDQPALHVIDEGRFGDPEEAARAKDMAGLVWGAAAFLNPKESSVLDLHLRQGLDSAEIAQVMGISKGNAYTILSRLKNTFEEAVVALVMMKNARTSCVDLDRILTTESTSVVSASLRRLVGRHVDACPACLQAKATLLSPAALFGAFAMAPLQVGLKANVAEVLRDQWHIIGPAAVGGVGAATGVLHQIWFWLTAPWRWLKHLLHNSKTSWPYQTTAWKASHIAVVVVAVGGGAAVGVAVAGGGDKPDPTLLSCSYSATADGLRVDALLTDANGTPLAEQEIDWSKDGAPELRIGAKTSLTEASGETALVYEMPQDGVLQAHRVTAEYRGSSGHKAASCSVETPGVTPTPAPRPPECADLARAVQAGTSVLLDLPCGSANGSRVSCEIIAPPRNGSLPLDGCSGTYTPNPGFIGEDAFSYKSAGANGTSNTGTGKITVTSGPPPLPPSCSDRAVSTSYEAPVKVDLGGLCSGGSSALTCQVILQPFGGRLSGTGCSRTYTPSSGFSGKDSFTFKASDGVSDSNVATVRVSVSTPERPVVESVGCPAAVEIGTTFACAPSFGGGAPTSWTWSGGGSPPTGDRGTFTTSFDSLGPKAISLTACNSAGCSAAASQRVEVYVTQRPTELVCHGPGDTVTSQATVTAQLRSDGLPVAGRTIAWSDSPGLFSVSPGTSTTNSGGSASTIYRFIADAGVQGWETVSAVFQGDSWFGGNICTVTFYVDSPSTPTPTPEPAGGVRGSVYCDGEPVNGATIVVGPPLLPVLVWSGTTDESGNFDTGRTIGPGSYVVTAAWSQREFDAVDVVVVDGQYVTANFSCNLVTPGGIRGQIVDCSGLPDPEAYVEVVLGGTVRWGDWTDGNGRYETPLELAPSSDWIVRVNGEDWAGGISVSAGQYTIVDLGGFCTQ